MTKKKEMNTSLITVTLVKSLHGRKKGHEACVRGLGLKKIRQTVHVLDTPENRGMIDKVQYLLHVEAEEKAA